MIVEADQAAGIIMKAADDDDDDEEEEEEEEEEESPSTTQDRNRGTHQGGFGEKAAQKTKKQKSFGKKKVSRVRFVF